MSWRNPIWSRGGESVLEVTSELKPEGGIGIKLCKMEREDSRLRKELVQRPCGRKEYCLFEKLEKQRGRGKRQ